MFGTSQSILTVFVCKDPNCLCSLNCVAVSWPSFSRTLVSGEFYLEFLDRPFCNTILLGSSESSYLVWDKVQGHFLTEFCVRYQATIIQVFFVIYQVIFEYRYQVIFTYSFSQVPGHLYIQFSSGTRPSLHLVFLRYQAICHPLSLTSRYGAGRAKRVIMVVWGVRWMLARLVALSLVVVLVKFVIGKSTNHLFTWKI